MVKLCSTCCVMVPPLNPFYDMPYNPDGENWVDPGLGGFLKSAGYLELDWGPAWGKHRRLRKHRPRQDMSL